ncbi:MAG: hypothetical protein HC836_35515 [Richelia sp. RM2_1_2]|nr:hypothetical protein [Richelia sp. RM2_1_2]
MVTPVAANCVGKAHKLKISASTVRKVAVLLQDKEDGAFFMTAVLQGVTKTQGLQPLVFISSATNFHFMRELTGVITAENLDCVREGQRNGRINIENKTFR